MWPRVVLGTVLNLPQVAGAAVIGPAFDVEFFATADCTIAINYQFQDIGVPSPGVHLRR